MAEALIVSGILDFGSHEKKTINGVVVDGYFHNSATVSVAVDYSNSNQDGFIRTAFKEANTRGHSFIRIRAERFRIVVKVTNNKDMMISDIIPIVQFDTRKFSRQANAG